MSPAPGPSSDPVDRRARHREVPGPLEARWVPALLVCLTLGILGVGWNAPARSAAATISRPSSTVDATGFSTRICMLRAMQASAIS